MLDTESAQKLFPRCLSLTIFSIKILHHMWTYQRQLGIILKQVFIYNFYSTTTLSSFWLSCEKVIHNFSTPMRGIAWRIIITENWDFNSVQQQYTGDHLMVSYLSARCQINGCKGNKACIYLVFNHICTVLKDSVPSIKEDRSHLPSSFWFLG